MSHTIKQAFAVTAVLAGLFAVYCVWSPANTPVSSISNSTQRCEALLASTESIELKDTCHPNTTQVTWGHWVKGESRSAQFHFFDLLELLFSSSDSQTSSSSKFKQQSSL